MSGYESAVTGDAERGFTVTNVHKPGGVTYTVTRVCDDSDEKVGIRPDSVAVQLYADGKA